MAHLEESMIFCGPNIVQPTFYRRYVDDTFCLFTTKEEAERFLVFINNLHPNIRFEMETESDGKLEFLDTVVERRPDSTSHRTSTKVKQTDKGIYYHYSSFIPDSYKLNKIFTLVYRAYRIASDMSVFHVDVEKLKKRLRLNGFPTYLIDQVTSKVLMRYHAQQDNQQDTQQPDRERVYIALPYLGPVSIILKRQLTKLVQKFYPSVQLKVVFRRGFRISNLFNYKDKFPIACRSMIVYYIQFEAANKTLLSKRTNKKKYDPSSDRRVDAARRELFLAKDKYHHHTLEENREEVAVKKEALKSCYLTVEEEILQEKIRKVEESADRCRNKESWELINDISGRTRTCCGLTEGSSPAERLNNWKKHFAGLLGQPPSVPDANITIRNIHPPLDIDINPFTPEELAQAKKQIVEGKAFGDDGISPEVMKRVDLDEIGRMLSLLTM
ncbi:hypothetical protein ACHWQZ_G000954 [Mnemiopsis leidyi]